MTAKLKIGILGVSGNPVHMGHISKARFAHQQLGLDQVWLMVTPQNPLKDEAETVPFYHRFEMAQLAVQETGDSGKWLRASEFESCMNPPGHQYETYDTLRAFEKIFPNYQPVWLMGADNLAGFHNWSAWRDITHLWPMAIFSRPKTHLDDVLDSFAGEYIAPRRVEVADFSAKPGEWTLLEGEEHPASSTAIREAIAAGEKPDFVAPSVLSHIHNNKLYLKKPL